MRGQKINYIDKIRIFAVIAVFSLHSTLFVGKDFPMNDIIKYSDIMLIFFTPAWGGVWIFFVLSGYLAGTGYVKNRYELNISGISRYYLKKITKIYIPTIMFVGFSVVMINPSFLSDFKVLLSFFTSTYSGIPGFYAIGATWYVFSLMWLYFISPFVAMCYKRIASLKYILLIICLLGGATRGIFYLNEWDWHTMYVSPWCNLDLFCCGMGIAYLSDNVSIQVNFKLRALLLCFFASIILFCNYVWAYGVYFAVYQYVMPTFYLVAVCLYLYLFRIDAGRKYSFPRIEKMAKHFSTVSFSFYLFHSLIMGRIASHIGGHTVVEQYIKYYIAAFLITYIFSLGWHRMINYRSE